jgi:DNA polymerase-3 subunit alpha
MIDLQKIDMLDKKTFELLQAGRTACVFQLESGGMRDLLRKIRPNVFEDIIAVLALYRPGPLEGGMVDDFINRKHGKVEVKYELPELEPILKETYGVIVYQEQVMQISRALAGYSLGQADLLRRAMGKKKAEEMAKEKDKFLAGAKDGNVDLKKAEAIFDLMAKFAEYGFNKSHSAAYALVSYHTAYLKAHYPKEFMAAVLSYEVNNTDKVVAYTTETRDMGIKVYPPHVNHSELKFTTEGKDGIRFGLAAIRGVGEGAIESILDARAQDGPFTDINNLCERVDTRKVNRKVLEALVKGGAIDPEKKGGPHRAQIFSAIDAALEQSNRSRKDAEAGQFSMFGALAEAKPEAAATLPDVPAWKENELLAGEKEALGMYMSSHPLNKYQSVLQRYATATTASAKEAPTKKEVRIGVVTRAVKEKIGPRGRWGIVTFEDMFGSIDTFMFSDTFVPNADLVNSDRPIFIIGEVDRDEGGGDGGDGDSMQEARVKLIVKDVCPLDEVEQKYANTVHVQMQADEVNEQLLLHLKNAFVRNAGAKKCILHVLIPHKAETVIELPSEYAVSPTEQFFKEMHDLFGRDVARLL